MQIVIELPNGTTKVVQNDSEQPISPNSQLFQSFPTKVAQNDSEWPNLPDSQLFQSFPSKVALKMTLNSQFCPIHNFSNLYQLQMINSVGGGGRGKLPNANCEHQTTKWKSPNLPSTNDRFWGGGEGKLPNANFGHQTTNCNSINHKHYFTCQA